MRTCRRLYSLSIASLSFLKKAISDLARSSSVIIEGSGSAALSACLKAAFALKYSANIASAKADKVNISITDLCCGGCYTPDLLYYVKF